MKLFQRLLVAPAALGMLSPIAANASEVNFNAISNYSIEEIDVDSNTFNTNTSQPLLISSLPPGVYPRLPLSMLV